MVFCAASRYSVTFCESEKCGENMPDRNNRHCGTDRADEPAAYVQPGQGHLYGRCPVCVRVCSINVEFREAGKRKDTVIHLSNAVQTGTAKACLLTGVVASFPRASKGPLAYHTRTHNELHISVVHMEVSCRVLISLKWLAVRICVRTGVCQPMLCLRSNKCKQNVIF